MSNNTADEVETEREKMLAEALSSRTLLAVLLGGLAFLELLVIVQLSR
jgi:hypothetical protein